MRVHSKTPLFLMELIIMLVIFSISATVCLQIFAGAKRISEESRRLDAAVVQAQTIAETWKATHGNLEKTAESLGVLPEEKGFTVYDEKNQIYVEFRCEGPRADIIVLNREKEIFSLTCEAVMIYV